MTENLLDIGTSPTMTATIQIDLSKPEAIEQMGTFLESMNVVALTVASGGRAVHCIGRVTSLVPADKPDKQEGGER